MTYYECRCQSDSTLPRRNAGLCRLATVLMILWLPLYTGSETRAKYYDAKTRYYAGEMVSIPGGTFRMGDMSREGYDDERPVNSVTVPAFRMGKYEVTFTQWDACVADGGCGDYRPDDEGWGRGDRPVINVSWNDVQGFIDWLNDKTGGNFRLPTEAEWEYAARAGSTTKYNWGNNIGHNLTNCDKNGCGDQWEYTAPVGSFPANAWGLHDMHGNVWEWAQDCWHGSYEEAPDDGSAWTSGDCDWRVRRSGSWFDQWSQLASANRTPNKRPDRFHILGFRLASESLAEQIASVPVLPPGISAGETCAGKREGSTCWMALEDRPWCHIWNPNLRKITKAFVWSAECVGGLVEGTGELRWVGSFRESGAANGQVQHGKRHGLWVERYPNGDVFVGSHKDGKRHGQWTERYANGSKYDGPYVDGNKHGQWVERYPNGDVFVGSHKDGKRHGQWTERYANGSKYDGPYVDGYRHGQWTERYPNGGEYDGPYMDGNKHGLWVERHDDGTVEEGSYVDGYRHGQWTERYANGSEYDGPYVDGNKHGQWVERLDSGSVWEGSYVDGYRHGQWTERYANGSEYDGPYVDGKKHGQWVIRDADGNVLERLYADDKEHGQWVFRDTDDKIIAEGHYEDGRRHGQWVFRKANGTVVEEMTYDGGWLLR